MEKKQNDASFVFLLTDAQTKMAVVGLQKTKNVVLDEHSSIEETNGEPYEECALKKHGKTRKETCNSINCSLCNSHKCRPFHAA